MPSIEVQRTLSVKLDLRLSQVDDKRKWQLLRDRSWQAMQYGNNLLRARWAEAAGLRVAPEADDKHDVTKHLRRYEKGELSSNVVDAIGREVDALWRRLGKRGLAGAPLPEFREGKSLSIRDRGIRIAFDGERFSVGLNLSPRSADQPWETFYIAKNTATDTYQAEILHAMAAGKIDAAKAMVQIHSVRGRAMLRLSYKRSVELPPPGERVAVIGPVTDQGRFVVRTELRTRDYTDRFTLMEKRKSEWDLIRRRCAAQIGRCKGHARMKRIRLSRLTWDDWLDTHLHQWTFDIVEWCASESVGRIEVAPLNTGEWPAFEFESRLKYKAEARGIEVVKTPDVTGKAAARAAKSEIQRDAKRVGKRQVAVRELQHQLTKEKTA